MHYPSTPVAILRPHRGFHFDEVVQAVFVRRFAGDHYPGIRNAKVVPGPPEASEEDSLLKRRTMLLGQGRRIFDDKDQNGKRLPNTCCAMRMADDIGLRKSHPELDKLYRAVTRVDSSDTATSLDMSNLIKAGVRSLPDHAHPQIFDWGERGVNQIIDYLSLEAALKAEGGSLSCDDYVLPSKVFEEMVAAEAVNPLAVPRMRKLIASSEKQVGNCIEMAGISRAMKVTGVSDKDAYDWMQCGLAYMSEMQIQYLEAKDEIARRGLASPIDPRFEGDDIELLYIESGNVQVANASRAEEFQYAVCIAKRPDRNLAIVPNKHSRIDMGAVIALVRMLETPKARRKGADFARYSGSGDIAEVPHVHVMESGTILNGSIGIETPVKITLARDQLIDIVKRGFTPEAVYWFNELRGGDGELSESEIAYIDRIHGRYAAIEAEYLRNRQYAAPVVRENVDMNETSLQELGQALDRA